MTSKRALREAAKAGRSDLARAAPDFARRIVAFVDLLPIPKGAIVAGYSSLRDEADPRLLMHAIALRGHILALPVIVARSHTLSFHAWKEGDPVSLNAYGIAEPMSGRLVEPSLILVPLLAFDTSGHRLGYGGGYYDRSLERTNARTIGIAYAGQEMKELLPRQQHDRRLDMILTERGLRRFE